MAPEVLTTRGDSAGSRDAERSDLSENRNSPRGNRHLDRQNGESAVGTCSIHTGSPNTHSFIKNPGSQLIVTTRLSGEYHRWCGSQAGATNGGRLSDGSASFPPPMGNNVSECTERGPGGRRLGLCSRIDDAACKEDRTGLEVPDQEDEGAIDGNSR